jgi:hypothetical protein
VPGGEFALPQGWYHNTVSRLVQDTLPPLLGPLTAETAWRYVYACVLWTERKDGRDYPHLNDRLSSKGGRELAERGREYLEEYLAPGSAVPLDGLIDWIAREYRAERHRQGSGPNFQRNNVTGNGMEATLQVLIERICGVRPPRTPLLRTLRGFELAPVGYHSRPDLVLFTPQDFRVLISTKWTLRKERIGTYLHEAYFYKQRRSDLQIAFVISEFNRNIVEWLVNDPLVDRVYHVHLPMLLAVHRPFRGAGPGAAVEIETLLAPLRSRDVQSYARWLRLSDRLFDLRQLFADVDALKASPALDAPEEEVSVGLEDSDDDE